MLVVSSAAATATLRGHHGNCQVGKVEGNAMYEEGAAAAEGNEFIPDLWDGNSSLLLEGIDIDDLFAVGIDFLPDLEMDPSEIQADFSPVIDDLDGANTDDFITVKRPREEEVPGSGSSRSGQEGCSNLSNKGGEDTRGSASPSSSSVVLNPPAPVTKNIRGGEKARRKSTTTAQGIDSKNNNHGKRKVKVDWTPELHRRFVQAVEQLGVDKAVPSRILELMGIDCLTRHNVASHLQKYRSHRKHLLAREAEAVSWNQRRQVYGGDGAAAGGKRDHHKHAWQQAPIMGFPPPLTPPPPPPMHHLIRPLHVWGHPSMGGQPVIHIWPKHIPHHQHPTWTPPPPTAAAADTSYWHHQRVPVAAAGIGQSPGIRCNIPQQLLPQTRSLATAVPGIPPPPHSMYKTEAAAMGRQPQSGSSPSHLFDIQPSKESIDAAIGDVLSYPWLPLPLGLKPPAVDSVLMELQRQGIPHIPPATSS